jgi:RNA polymerase sigma factor (sigma-70 family)
MTEETDEALVTAVRAGDQGSFTELVRRHEKYIYGTAIAILADFELAQDVAQEAFVAAYSDLAKLKDAQRFGEWLRGILRHKARRALRERMRNRDTLSAWCEVAPQADLATPEQNLQANQRRQIVARSLERINRGHRDVLCLYYLDGLSYADVAAYLGLTVTVVKGRLQRGRQRLQAELTIVEEHFMDNQLPTDFAQRIQRLLDGAASGALRDDTMQELTTIGPAAVESLCEALADERKWVRHVAILSLCEIGDPRAREPVLRLFHGSGPYWVPHSKETGWIDRQMMSRVLSIPGCRDGLLRMVESCIKSAGQRTQEAADLQHRTVLALYALSGAVGDEIVYDTVKQLLDTSNPEFRVLRNRALHTLCDIDTDGAPALITRVLQGADEAMYAAAFQVSLPNRAVTHAVQVPVAACVQGIEQGPHQVKRSAVVMLLEQGIDGRKALDELLTSGSKPTRAIVAATLARMGDSSGMKVLDDELLGTAQDQEGFVPWDVREGRDHRRETLRVNLWNLALKYPDSAGELVEGIYAMEGPNLQRAALKILCRQRGATMLPELRRHLSSARPHNNLLAKEAYWQMARLGEAAAPTALSMLDSDDWKQRKAAVCLLRRWGILTATQKSRAAADPHVAVQHAVGERRS